MAVPWSVWDRLYHPLPKHTSFCSLFSPTSRTLHGLRSPPGPPRSSATVATEADHHRRGAPPQRRARRRHRDRGGAVLALPGAARRGERATRAWGRRRGRKAGQGCRFCLLVVGYGVIIRSIVYRSLNTWLCLWNYWNTCRPVYTWSTSTVAGFA